MPAARTSPAPVPVGLIPVELARELAAAGLVWVPAQGDRFVIDRPGLTDQTWVLSDMVVEVHDHPAGQILGFNGTTEWALDSVDAHQALWLPAEDHMRTLLGPAFSRLERRVPPDSPRAGATFRVTLLIGGELVGFEATEPATAYGRALLHVLRSHAQIDSATPTT